MKNKTDKRELFIKFLIKLFDNLTVVWPVYLAFVALQLLSFYLVSRSYIENSQNELIAFVLASIGISLALSSACFTYSQSINKLTDKKLILKSGELFLHSSVKFVLGLLIIYLLIYFSKFKDIQIPNFLNLILKIFNGFVYLSSYLFINNAIIVFHRGLYIVLEFQKSKINYGYGLTDEENILFKKYNE